MQIFAKAFPKTHNLFVIAGVFTLLSRFANGGHAPTPDPSFRDTHRAANHYFDNAECPSTCGFEDFFLPPTAYLGEACATTSTMPNSMSHKQRVMRVPSMHLVPQQICEGRTWVVEPLGMAKPSSHSCVSGYVELTRINHSIATSMPRPRYVGCFKNEGVARIGGHETRITYHQCKDKGSSIFGMEFAQGYKTPEEAQCLLLRHHSQYKAMVKAPDADCAAEVDSSGNLLGGWQRLAVYEWATAADSGRRRKSKGLQVTSRLQVHCQICGGVTSGDKDRRRGKMHVEIKWGPNTFDGVIDELTHVYILSYAVFAVNDCGERHGPPLAIVSALGVKYAQPCCDVNMYKASVKTQLPHGATHQSFMVVPMDAYGPLDVGWTTIAIPDAVPLPPAPAPPPPPEEPPPCYLCYIIPILIGIVAITLVALCVKFCPTPEVGVKRKPDPTPVREITPPPSPLPSPRPVKVAIEDAPAPPMIALPPPKRSLPIHRSTLFNVPPREDQLMTFAKDQPKKVEVTQKPATPPKMSRSLPIKHNSPRGFLQRYQVRAHTEHFGNQHEWLETPHVNLRRVETLQPKKWAVDHIAYEPRREMRMQGRAEAITLPDRDKSAGA